MKVWILNHYAETPEGRATRSYDLARLLAERGHDISIFASGFSHYQFREERLAPGERWRTEVRDGVRFYWLRTNPYRRNDLRRVANMVSYFNLACRLGSSLPAKPDVVIGTHMHPLGALAGHVLARRKGARFFFEITDLWPQTLVDVGALSPIHPLVLFLRVWEKYLYRRADRIIALLPQAHEYITRFGVPREKILWIPNGVDVSRYDGLEKFDGKIGKSFDIYYLGGLVRSNHLDVVLDAAKILAGDRSPAVRFVFAGEGTDKPRLMERARSLGLRNVAFQGVFAKKDIARVMEPADAFIFSLKDLPLYRFGISLNKMCDYLASRRPILFAGNPPHNPVAEAGCGLVLRPEDPVALAEGVRKMAALPAAERVRMGRNGFEYLRRNHDMRVLADRLEAALRESTDGV